MWGWRRRFSGMRERIDKMIDVGALRLITKADIVYYEPIRPRRGPIIKFPILLLRNVIKINFI